MHEANVGRQLGPYYHGTVHPFKPGEVVKPMGDESHAYATPDIEYAHRRARDWVNYSWEDKKKVNPTWNYPGGKQFDEYAAETPPKVFEVKPIGTPEPSGDSEDEGHVKSTVGFRVVRQVR